MKKQKKQFLILLVLLFVIVGGGLGALKYIEYQEQKEAEKIAAETIYITKLDPDEIESFICWYKTGDGWDEREFVKKDEKWIAMKNPSAELQQSLLKRMADELAQMTAVKKLEGVVDFAAYGFDDVFKKYTIHTADKTYEITLGGFNDLTDCYYMSSASEPSVVYMVEPSYVTAFVSTVEALKVVEQ